MDKDNENTVEKKEDISNAIKTEVKSEDSIESKDSNKSEDSIESKDSNKSEDSIKSEDGKKNSKIGNIIRYVVMAVALCVFCYSAYELISIYSEYREGEQEYSDLTDKIFETKETVKETKTLSDGETVADTVEVTQPEEEFIFDFDSLYNINNDACGWILINGTQISYPLVQGNDNDYYLTHTINGTYNGAGTIFLDARVENGFEADNAIIYGHNMKNGTMFGELKRYKSQDYYNEHSIIDIFTQEGMYCYNIVATAVVDPADQMIYTYDFTDESHFTAYRDYINSIKLYDTGVSIYSDDRLITLSTCTGDSTQRFVVIAKRVKN